MSTISLFLFNFNFYLFNLIFIFMFEKNEDKIICVFFSDFYWLFFHFYVLFYVPLQVHIFFSLVWGYT